jgi:hypothetical protein
MTWDHVIHRFQFDGIDLKAARFSVNQASKCPRPVFPITTETSSSFRYETFTKAELATNGIILTPSVKQSLPIDVFKRRRLDFLGPGGAGEEMGTRAPKETTEEPFFQKGTAIQFPAHVPSMGKLQNLFFPFIIRASQLYATFGSL